MNRTHAFAALAAVAALSTTACKKKPADESATGGSGAGSATMTMPGDAGATVGSANGSAGSAFGSAGDAAAGTVSGTIIPGFSTPESVLLDTANDRYLVSNINGDAVGADDNGFISTVSRDGKVTQLKWIDGGAADVKLDGPKGLAITDGTLWVADITTVRKFDLATGKSTGDVPIAGATFLNDVVPDGSGGVYVSDTGVDAKFQPNGTDAIHHIDKAGKVSPLIKGKDLGGPNGIAAGPDGSLWVVTFVSGELYPVDATGKQGASEKPPKGQLDGVIALDGGELLVTSWESATIYRGKPGGPWTEAVTGMKAPADIGWDPERKVLMIPRFQDNEVVLHPMP